jgi:glycosyltransferase involved in cell wall biosynthesis
MTARNARCSSVKGQPLVSAVIPTRNRPDLVCRAVRSVLAQTYSNVEAVVVIDGPDAVTASLLKTIGDSRIRIVPLEENVGGSEARNIGVRESRGEYIALLDDDDEWLPTKIKKQVAVAVQCPGAVVTCRHVKRRPNVPDVLLPIRLQLPAEPIGDYLFRGLGAEEPAWGPQTSTYLASRGLFIVDPFVKGLPCHQDWDWFLRVMSRPEARHEVVDEPLTIFHVSAEAAGVTSRTKWRQSLAWIESVRHTLSSEAYASFIIHQVMYRCDVTSNRLRTFWTLGGKVRSASTLSFGAAFNTTKWLIFSPQLRSFVKYYLRAVA